MTPCPAGWPNGHHTHTMLITNDHLEPRFQIGGRFLLRRTGLEGPRVGEYWVFVAHENEDPYYIAGKLERKARSRWHVSQLNNPHDFRLPRDEWRPAFRIVGSFDLD